MVVHDAVVTRDEQMALTDTVKELIGLAKKPSELATMRESQTYVSLGTTVPLWVFLTRWYCCVVFQLL